MQKNDDSEQAKPVLSFQKAMDILRRPGVLNVILKKNAPIVPALLLFSSMNVAFFSEINPSFSCT